LPIADVVRERGPMTVAAFMDLALYDTELGYYARAAQRSGRAGDFFTSVDVGPLFGELLEVQLAEMGQLTAAAAEHAEPNGRSALSARSGVRSFDLVEAGAGNGRLSADILRAARDRDPAFYDSLRLHLVETSDEARRAQADTLGDVVERLASSTDSLPSTFQGVLVANELLDALPVHQVVMREDGLKEVYVVSDGDPAASAPESLRRDSDELGGVADERRREMVGLHLAEGPPSTPALGEYLERLGVTLETGWRVEINLRAVDWIRGAARRLERGFIILIDYGHEARELYSETHAAGTLTTFARHRSVGPESAAQAPAWLRQPGEQDITAHVDFTSVRAAAEAEGLTTLGFLDQTYFLLGVLPSIRNPQSAIRNLKTLVMPGGLGSTHKVLMFGKGVGTPALRGCSFSLRVT
jgi:SAM-dependent MidA family methyltransferase